MRLLFFKNTLLLTLFVAFSCGSTTTNTIPENESTLDDLIEAGVAVKEDAERDIERKKEATLQNEIIVAAALPQKYFPLLQGKRIAVVANQTSRIGTKTIENDMHLVDYLLKEKINVQKVFAPEHGFRGTADAGELVKDGIDTATGLPIISLYGNNKKPTAAQLQGLDMVVFDIQDVGARFYTYISTLHYVMEACAEAGIPVMVLDRPNPNGRYIDGPILEPVYKSFVGMHPVPVVHGMTIAEYAQMINGEKWLNIGIQCDLTVIPMDNYLHEKNYSLPVKPSPNLPNDQSINLYPSLCFFEGTVVSAGRGTDKQFQIFGAPELPSEKFTFQFTPQSNEGAKYPKFKGQLCNGRDLSEAPQLDKINLEWLIEAYVGYGKKKEFFNDFFTNLAGTKKLQQQIEQGLAPADIRATWAEGLTTYDLMRKKYLLYE
ncbi:exo-beta-N-acetylmuramidase NamZ domain-containing protein [Jejudonia soesokkakensis]|uniref:Exo-beta-N-acetylmuramidase NamZ domain-containing protein n=1 Tax=Jejudonia soesokkakensis TaxID=1323432 RepID=A0ABW2MQF4_9FLAO